MYIDNQKGENADYSATKNVLNLAGVAPKDQFDAVYKRMTSDPVAGESWFFISEAWYSKWVKYCSSEAGPPGPIDNWTLVNVDVDCEQVIDGIMEGVDYHLFPEDTWNFLVETFELAPCPTDASTELGPTLKRPVILEGTYFKEPLVELRPPSVHAFFLPNTTDLSNVSESTFKQVSRSTTIANLKTLLSTHFCPELIDSDTRLWLILLDAVNSVYCFNIASNMPESLSKFGVNGNTRTITMLLEAKCEGKWPMASDVVKQKLETEHNICLSEKNEKRFGALSDTLNRSSEPKRFETRKFGTEPCGKEGLCGLQNIGNTCFMNSALQCISNVWDLTKFCLNDTLVQTDLNTKNPLGTGGALALEYAKLMKVIWCGENLAFNPRDFKKTIGSFAPRFIGYQQQDSQELLAYLMDGLHEDLNRIKVKPYFENPDFGPITKANEAEVADKFWNMYLSRNQSIIVDLFHGQLKSTLTCDQCGFISIIFEPICHLPLPVPEKTRVFHVDVISAPSLQNPQSETQGTSPGLGRRTINLPNSAYNNCVKFGVDQGGMNGIVARLNEDCDADENLDASQLWAMTPKYMSTSFTTSTSSGECLAYRCDSLERKCVYVSNHYTSYTSTYSSTPSNKPAHLTLWRVNPSDSRVVLFSHSPPTIAKPFLCGLTGTVGYEDICGMVTARYGIADTENGDTPMEVDDNENQAPDDESGDPRESKFFSIRCWNNPYGSIDNSNMGFIDSIVKAVNVEPCEANDDGETVTVTEQNAKCLPLEIVWKKDENDLTKVIARFPEADYDPLTLRQSQLSVPPATEHDPAKQAGITLDACVKLFTSTERLGEHDLWYCPKCKKHVQAFKKFDIWKLPPYLVIHLKRFSVSRYSRDKIDSVIDFPTGSPLDLGRFCDNPMMSSAQYRLIAVSNHFGGLGGGHYTAHAYNAKQKRWFYFDDSSVSPADVRDVSGKDAYFLVYQRINHDANGI